MAVAERKTVSQFRHVFCMIASRSSPGWFFVFLMVKIAFFFSRFVRMKFFLFPDRVKVLSITLFSVLLCWCWMMCVSAFSLGLLVGGPCVVVFGGCASWGLMLG